MSTTTLPVTIEPPVNHPAVGDDGLQTKPWLDHAQDIADRLTALTQRVGLIEGGSGVGITDGSDAPAGHVGEYLSHSGAAVSLTSAATVNVVSLDLAAGDWDVSGSVVFSPSAGTNSFFGAGMGGLDVYLAATFSAAALNQALNTSTRRYNVTATTTVWVVARAVFTGTCTAIGTAHARRMR